MVAVAGAALLQDVEPSRVMDVDTLLRGDVLGWVVQGWSAGMGSRPALFTRQPWSRDLNPLDPAIPTSAVLWGAEPSGTA